MTVIGMEVMRVEMKNQTDQKRHMTKLEEKNEKQSNSVFGSLRCADLYRRRLRAGAHTSANCRPTHGSPTTDYGGSTYNRSGDSRACRDHCINSTYRAETGDRRADQSRRDSSHLGSICSNGRSNE